jgi:uncharacterized RDD family membrane protein YckC
MGMVYELCLVYFAISFVASYVLLSFFQWKWPISHSQSAILSTYLFIIYGFYFTYFWHHGGQTLPMKTVELKLTTVNGDRVSLGRAWWRYLLCWWGLMPGALIATAAPHLNVLAFLTFLGAFLGSVAWAKIDRDGQFLHDRLAGTRLALVYRG